MKSVAIVGGGPAGLVAAKTLIHRPGNPFKVHLFESAQRVGGMWRPRADEEGDKCSPHMRANLSKFTVAFSDLSWDEVDLDAEDGRSAKTIAPMFPRAYQVGQYLEEYAKRFLPDGVVFCNTEVRSAKREGQPSQWSLSTRDKSTQEDRHWTFDYLIVASGFFDRPNNPIQNNSNHPSTRSRHSSRFRSVAFLTDKPGNITVVGGGISGIDAASTAASQLSNAQHASGKPKPAWSSSKIYHVFDRPFYVLPRYLPQDSYSPAIQDFNPAPTFLPLDLVLYDLSRRGDGAISASIGPVPPDKCHKSHDFLRNVLGGDQRDLGYPALVCHGTDRAFPSYTGISDTYSEFVRSGVIVPIQGRVGTIVEEGAEKYINLHHSTPWLQHRRDRLSREDRPLALDEAEKRIDGVVGIIEATGFQVHLTYLDEEVKTLLDYDPTCSRIPFLLSRGSVFNPQVPELAFIGFYEGPYWGVMEMQAQLVAHKWDPQPSSTPLQEEDVKQSASAKTRQALKRGGDERLSVPHFWMQDYVGLIEEFSRLAGIQRHDTEFEGQAGPAFPARYATKGTHQDAVAQVIKEVSQILQASENEARFVAAAAFGAMQGKWVLQRKITSRHPSSPGGHFSGTANFHPREPTASAFSTEYLYIEDGTLAMDNGLSFPATRRYVYRYNESADRISTWFVQEDGESAERLFNELTFERPGDAFHGWIAKSDHFCSPDTYKTSCEFRFRGAGLESFGIVYRVEGPSKDYEHETWYKRPSPPASKA